MILTGGQKKMSFDYLIILENIKTGKQFCKGFNSPYLFEKALKKYRYSKKLRIVSYIKNSY